jgi:hypothetical protein
MAAAAMPTPLLALDHLVLAAATLAQGLDWCEATLGIRPDAGGRHALMGTHNRVFAIGSARFPRAYFEIIAIDPDAPAPPHPRWFDLDDAALQGALARGPQLVHWVARCDSIAAAGAALLVGGIDSGEPRQAERMTPQGLLRWRIGVRADGHRPLGGAGPALIEWGERHPTDSMPAGGVTLQAMRLAGWPAALAATLPAAIESDPRGEATPISVTLATSRGPVILETPNLGTGT